MEWAETLLPSIKHRVLEAAASVGLPADLLPFLSAALSISPILMFFPFLFAMTTIFERKGLGRIQNRYGPNRVGIPFTDIRLAGFGQFIADGIKSLTKEDVVPRVADRLVHTMAPVLMVMAGVMAFAVLPIGRELVALELDAGLLFFFAFGGLAELAIFMAGWSSRNKYSLLGAMRGIAQMISYEMPLILSTLVVVMAAGTLSPMEIVRQQAEYGKLGIAQWHIFSPWGALGFVLFFIAALAEANRSPFDLTEGESELVAGFCTEYSGFKFALFFMAEYMGLFAALGMGISLFLGGWSAPFQFLSFVPSFVWFLGKLLLLIFLVIWIRGTMPRIRMDQLMAFAWKFMLPLALLNFLLVGAVRFMPSMLGQWLAAIPIILFAWGGLGRALSGGRMPSPRTYRFAE